MFNDEFNRIFKQMSSSFGNLDDVFEMLKTQTDYQNQSISVIP